MRIVIGVPPAIKLGPWDNTGGIAMDSGSLAPATRTVWEENDSIPSQTRTITEPDPSISMSAAMRLEIKMIAMRVEEVHGICRSILSHLQRPPWYRRLLNWLLGIRS